MDQRNVVVGAITGINRKRPDWKYTIKNFNSKTAGGLQFKFLSINKQKKKKNLHPLTKQHHLMWFISKKMSL